MCMYVYLCMQLCMYVCVYMNVNVNNVCMWDPDLPDRAHELVWDAGQVGLDRLQWHNIGFQVRLG